MSNSKLFKFSLKTNFQCSLSSASETLTSHLDLLEFCYSFKFYLHFETLSLIFRMIILFAFFWIHIETSLIFMSCYSDFQLFVFTSSTILKVQRGQKQDPAPLQGSHSTCNMALHRMTARQDCTEQINPPHSPPNPFAFIVVFLKWGWLCFQGTFGNVWRYFWQSHWRKCSCNLVGSGFQCC